jgi:hypothetical protein
VDDHFTSAPERAVEEWQDHRSLSVTGAVDDQVVFLAGAVRIKEAKAPVGNRPSPVSRRSL